MTPWQIALVSLAGFFLFLLFLLVFGRARLSLSYETEFAATLSILGVKITLFGPKKEKKAVPGKDLTDCKNPEKEIRRALKLQQRKAAKAKKKQAKAAAKKAKRQQKKAAKKQKHPSPSLSAGEMLSLVVHLVKKAYAVTKGKFRLRIRRLTIVVGSPDAATTAILYGSLSGLLSGLLDFLDANYIPTKIDRDGVLISPDFTAEKTRASISLDLSTTLFRALGILARGGVAYLRERAEAEAHAKKRLQAEALESSSADAE